LPAAISSRTRAAPRGHMFVGSKRRGTRSRTPAAARGLSARFPPRRAAPQVVPREGITEAAACAATSPTRSWRPMRMINSTASAAGSGAVRHMRRTCSTRSTRSASRAARRGAGVQGADAKFHTVAFCSRCGSKVRAFHGARHRRRPCGSLDTIGHPANGAHLRREQGPCRHHDTLPHSRKCRQRRLRPPEVQGARNQR